MGATWELHVTHVLDHLPACIKLLQNHSYTVRGELNLCQIILFMSSLLITLEEHLKRYHELYVKRIEFYIRTRECVSS